MIFKKQTPITTFYVYDWSYGVGFVSLIFKLGSSSDSSADEESMAGQSQEDILTEDVSGSDGDDSDDPNEGRLKLRLQFL